ncbi:zinc-dependent alcohol dehydrogenase [Halopenitus persicus]|uniref:zinc-dependent alcohol dehydrogenase n=1 Tax=Halopenitus persicus TaxID=1048396 RepID=UPI000BBB64B4|nr:zinc-binding alcohol dehydrogenase [Halopenitus persicus]
MSARTVRFTGDEAVEVAHEPVPEVTPQTVLVETTYSGISAGTEGLVYRGDVPRPLQSAGTVQLLEEDFTYPVAYGYATVGRVVAVGEAIDDDWLDERVFAYAPHSSHVRASPAELVRIPDSIPSERAPLLANVETAVTLVLDANPAIGERVAVFGQGIVGLLVTGLLAESPLEDLVAVEPLAERRERARRMGASHAVPPDAGDPGRAIREAIGERVDGCLEVSGNPDALENAITATRYDGRVIVGSWYGTKPVDLPLGGRFHRSRIDVESSQVSTIAPRHRGRWSRERRHEVAWDWLESLPVGDLITHRIPVEEADRAYELLAEHPRDVGQMLLTYE